LTNPLLEHVSRLAAEGKRDLAAVIGTSPAGLHQSCIIPLVESGVISAITTTGANLYHDAHRVLKYYICEVNPNAGDLQYRVARIIRIYDLGFQSPDSEAAKPMVFATTLLLIALVVVLNLTAIQIRTHLRRKYQASAF
jgi:ABC-type phosphate transport system permease subunit